MTETANKLINELKKFKYMLNYSFINAGKLLYEIRTTKAFKDAGYKSFTEFLADPEYGMPKSTAYLYSTIYKFFVVDRAVDENDLMDIDVVRLRDLIPVIKLDKGELDEWLHKARELGKGDFYHEVNDALGREQMEIQLASPDEDEVPVVKTTYLSIVKGSSCCVCGGRPVDAHHFPATKGGGNTDDRCIPLCRGCHIAYHQDPKEFYWTHKKKIIDFFYELIDALIKVTKDANAEVSDIPMS